MSKQACNNIFPFSAIQGQTLFKLALLLTTVNPALGGVLISGPRGCAKSTLARAVADLLPNQTGKFVSLPLGASEEMLIGTLDLDHALKDGALKFSPGLLQKAHQGVLYVDEVNLLPDHLVDQLLDVASSGVNIIERDGISHQHEAKFALIGTMNPDEGELRPQLQDRFGLMVELDNQYSVEERICIMKARQNFEQDSESFCQAYDEQQIQLQQQISHAQRLLTRVSCDDTCLSDIAKRCLSANVDGLRADIMMHRASLTQAAWCGRTSVTMEDIELVAPLVLMHRRQNGGGSSPPNDSSGNSSKQSEPKKSAFSRPESASHRPTNALQGEQENHRSGDWGAMAAQSGEALQVDLNLASSMPNIINGSLSQASKKSTYGNQYGLHKGHYSKGNHRGLNDSAKLNWFSTLAQNLGQWPPKRFVFQKAQTGEQKLHLILLDTSASTLTDRLSVYAKSVVMKIIGDAYFKRDKIVLLGFGNDQVDTIIKPGRAPKQVTKLLNNINALGGTPLRLILEKAAESIQQFTQRYPGISLFCYLITDGRTRANVDDLKLNIPTLLVDIEKSSIKRGRGQLLAEQLAAQYVAIDS